MIQPKDYTMYTDDYSQQIAWRRDPLDIASSSAQIERASSMIGGEAALPALRWYWAEQTTLILGVFQKPETINMEAAERMAVPVVRRRSGGTAVLAGNPLLSIDIAIPNGHPLAPADVTESYNWLGSLWLATLEEFGLRGARLVSISEARANPYRPPRPGQEDEPLSDDSLAGLSCYASLSPYEVAIGRRKIVGLAQVRRRGGVLYQVGVPLSWDSELLAHLLARREEDYPRLFSLLEERCTGLDRVMPVVPDRFAIMATFERLLAERHGVRLAASGKAD